ncbi:MAG: hypothetical protein N2200_06070 [Bacteroidia bacterium]|nr:hypothetical protein [Bacteroidia bacterium]
MRFGLLALIPFFSTAQNLHLYPQELGYVVWGIYHPLERGRDEALAYSIAQSLFSDSILQEVAYIHNIRYDIQRISTWLIITGTGLPEGVYAFFATLRGAMERFPQRLQYGIDIKLSSHPLGPYFRWVYEDTATSGYTPLMISQAFYKYWYEGRLHIFLRGRVPILLQRAANQLLGGESQPFEYIPPEIPSPLYQPPRKGFGVVYVRWRLEMPPSLASLIALWSHAQALLRFLCEERQIACSAIWVPLPNGMEGWIETGLPAAAGEAAKDFLTRPYRPSPHSTASFFSWIHASENLHTAAWYASVWGLSLPKELPTVSTRHLQKYARRWKTVTFSLGE